MNLCLGTIVEFHINSAVSSFICSPTKFIYALEIELFPLAVRLNFPCVYQCCIISLRELIFLQYQLLFYDSKMYLFLYKFHVTLYLLLIAKSIFLQRLYSSSQSLMFRPPCLLGKHTFSQDTSGVFFLSLSDALLLAYSYI